MRKALINTESGRFIAWRYVVNMDVPPDCSLVDVADDSLELHDRSVLVGGVWQTNDALPLPEIKMARWAYIKTARTTAIDGGFTAAGYAFDSGATAQTNITQAAQAAFIAKVDNVAFSVDWTLADDSTVTLTRAQTIALGQALQTHIAAQHTKARQRRAAILAATTKEEVEAIGW